MTTDQLVLGSRGGDTLDEALALGQGVERPFCCPVHGDSHASASVNVIKGVWFCHSCHAKGRVDDKRAPSIDELYAMMKPDAPTRIYPDEWLALFTGVTDYWATRFPDWLCWAEQLGHDPFTGDATFPVRTPSGQLAGVGRRRKDGEPRYLYPRNWSAASSLAGGHRYDTHRDVVVLVEGHADKTSLAEIGADAYGCYGAGLHAPQFELVLRGTPKLIVAAFDADTAGRRANDRATEALSEHAPVVVIDWAIYGAKDPAELDPATRLVALTEVVSAHTYRSAPETLDRWAGHVRMWQEAWRLAREEQP